MFAQETPHFESLSKTCPALLNTLTRTGIALCLGTSLSLGRKLLPKAIWLISQPCYQLAGWPVLRLLSWLSIHPMQELDIKYLWCCNPYKWCRCIAQFEISDHFTINSAISASKWYYILSSQWVLWCVCMWCPILDVSPVLWPPVLCPSEHLHSCLYFTCILSSCSMFKQLLHSSHVYCHHTWSSCSALSWSGARLQVQGGHFHPQHYSPPPSPAPYSLPPSPAPFSPAPLLLQLWQGELPQGWGAPSPPGAPATGSP